MQDPDIDTWMFLTAARWARYSDSKLRWLVRRLEKTGRMSAVILVLTEYLDQEKPQEFMRVLQHSGERDPTRLARYALLASCATAHGTLQVWEELYARGWWDPTFLARAIYQERHARFDWLLARTESGQLAECSVICTPLRHAVAPGRTTPYFARELIRRGARFPPEEKKRLPHTLMERYAKHLLAGLRLLYLARHPRFPLPEAMMVGVVRMIY